MLQAKKHIVTIDGYIDVPENNETLLLQAVATQPVSASICASDRVFQFYHHVSPIYHLYDSRFLLILSLPLL